MFLAEGRPDSPSEGIEDRHAQLFHLYLSSSALSRFSWHLILQLNGIVCFSYFGTAFSVFIFGSISILSQPEEADGLIEQMRYLFKGVCYLTEFWGRAGKLGLRWSLLVLRLSSHLRTVTHSPAPPSAAQALPLGWSSIWPRLPLPLWKAAASAVALPAQSGATQSQPFSHVTHFQAETLCRCFRMSAPELRGIYWSFEV